MAERWTPGDDVIAVQRAPSPGPAGGTYRALQRRLQRFERWDFLTREPITDSVDQIVGGVRKDNKALLGQHARGFQQSCIIGEEGFLIADYFEFHPIRQSYLAGEHIDR